MSYFKWFEAHANKHRAIMSRLIAQNYTQEAILDYFTFDNMCLFEPDFCPLYATKTPCHPITHLNCYLCACPNFRFNDNGLRNEGHKCVKSDCAIHARGHRWFEYEDILHLDCTACYIPHTKGFIKKRFHEDWNVVMKECSVQ